MIETRDVIVSFGERTVLDGVSLHAPDGAVTGFVGPNGAGKTTLMKVIAGLLPADSGTAVVDGVAFRDATCPANALGIHINGEWLPARRSGLNHLHYVCSTQSIPGSRVKPALEAVGLWDARHRAIGTYSLGMRQRLGIAAAIVGDPANLMLDEPVNGLDPNGVIWLRDLLRRQASEGKAVLLSSHLMTELELVADKFVMLQHGRVRRQGTLAELHESSPDHEVYIEAPSLHESIAILERAGLTAKPERGGALVSGASPERVGQLVFGAGLALSHLSLRTQSLEEIFLTTTRQQPADGADQ